MNISKGEWITWLSHRQQDGRRSSAIGRNHSIAHIYRGDGYSLCGRPVGFCEQLAKDERRCIICEKGGK